MNLTIKIAAQALACATLIACQSTDQDITWVDYGDNPMENPQFMEDMTIAGMPGEHHARLAGYAGTWDVAGLWFAYPGAEAFPMTGTSTMRMILGGHYMLEEYKSEFMGEPFEGLLIQGYDNLRQDYFTIWMDSTSTGTMMSRGTRDERGVLHTSGTSYDLITPGGRPMRTTVTENGTREVVMRMYDTTRDGEEFLSMQMTYTRR
jgi:hypothetical protein